jgi:nitrous oxidase accessory protein NosD
MAAERVAAVPAVPVTEDMVIRTNTVLKPGVYKVYDANANGVIQIAADNITLDGTGVVIVGTNFRGYGIRMNGHSGLTLRNFTIRGFDYGILLEDATSVLLEKNDVSGNRKDIQTGFLDIGCGGCYGGGILLRNVRSSIVRGNTLTDESTGLEMIGSTGSTVYDNLLSEGPEKNEHRQDSAWGIRLDGSTGNLVRGNVADWVDRRRYGLDSGDSAAILLVSGSHDNRIISNSITHSGDGFFLGNSCGRASHRNYVYGNDGSFSPHNAFEATFSNGNVFERNWADRSDYGFWMGYSYDSRVTANEIAGNASMGIAIEHGHGNEIGFNAVTGNPLGIRLWAADTTCLFPECGTSCPSAGYNLHDNTINGNGTGLAIENTAGAAVSHNQLAANPNGNVQVTGQSTGVDLRRNDLSCPTTIADPAICLSVLDQMDAGLDVAAARNFWGTLDPAAIALRIVDHEDDPHFGRVTFQPFQPAPPLAADLPVGCQGGEVVSAPLRNGPRAALTRLTYEGRATLDIAGTGQVAGGTRSDAFYLYARADGTPIPPVHPRRPDDRLLALDNQPMEAWLVDRKVPPYRPDHHYAVRIRAPRGRIAFGVTTPLAPGSVGQYTIGLCGGTP